MGVIYLVMEHYPETDKRDWRVVSAHETFLAANAEADALLADMEVEVGDEGLDCYRTRVACYEVKS